MRFSSDARVSRCQFHMTPGPAPRVAAEREEAERAADERDPEAREDPAEGAAEERPDRNEAMPMEVAA